MNAAAPSSDADPLVELAEEYAERFRRGERPALTEYTDKYPDLADRIRNLFPAMVMMEEFGSVAGPSTDPHAAAGAAPRQLGEYRILREVGRGGMGVVYEAVQESLGRHVALKVLAAQTWKNSTHLERFRREARAVARLHHTNIVPVFGTGEAEGVHYYAMQFIVGQSLDSVLYELKRLRRARSARSGESTDDPPATNVQSQHRHALSASIARGLASGQFPERGADPLVAAAAPTATLVTPPFTSWGGDGRSDGRPSTASIDGTSRSELTGQPDAQYFRGVARIGVQAAEALAYAHHQGILHRDVKPSNLLLDTQGTIWVTDFGLAKSEDSEELTAAGDIVGTVRYMAPERFKGHADPRSDVYALGLTLYEMLTLRAAFDSTDRARLIDRITRECPPVPRKIDPRIPRDLETVVLKAIAREPAARYPTATALAEDLGRYLADRPIRARRISWAGHTRRWCRRNPAVAGLLTTVAALLVASVVVLAVSNARISGALEQEKEAKDKEKEAKDKLEQTLYYQWVGAAADARDKGLAARAEEFLELCPHRLRGWEWHYVKRLPFASFPPLKHGDRDDREKILTFNAFSRDGSLLAVGSRDGSVSVWDARTGERLVAPFQAHRQFIRGLEFSPDDQFLATCGHDNCVKLWKSRTGKLVQSYPIDRAVVFLALAYSPDGQRLAASDQEQRVWVWDTVTGHRTDLKSPDRLAIGGLQYSVEGGHLLAVSTEGVVLAWDAAATGGEPARLFDAGFPGVHGAIFSPDRQLIAMGTEEGTVRVVRTDPWKVEHTLKAHAVPINGLAFGAGGDRLAVAASNMTIQLWDMRTGQEAFSVDLAGYRWLFLVFSPDGQRLAASNTSEGTVYILDGTPLNGPGSGGEVVTLKGHEHMVGRVAYSSDGQRIASASWDGIVRVWNVRAEREILTLPTGKAPVSDVSFSRDGRRIAASSWDGAIWVWDATTGQQLYPPIRAQAGAVYGVAFNRDGSALASAHHDGKVRIWVTDTGEWRQDIPAHGHPITALASSPDGERLVTSGGKDQNAKVWKWARESADRVLTLTGPQSNLRKTVFSPDGQRVAGMLPGLRKVWLWDATDGGESERPGKLFTIPGNGLLQAAIFHPDRRRIVVVSDDGNYLLDPETGATSPAQPTPHAGDVQCAIYSPDGMFLATGAGYRGYGEIRIWDVSRLEREP